MRPLKVSGTGSMAALLSERPLFVFQAGPNERAGPAALENGCLRPGRCRPGQFARASHRRCAPVERAPRDPISSLGAELLHRSLARAGP